MRLVSLAVMAVMLLAGCDDSAQTPAMEAASLAPPPPASVAGQPVPVVAHPDPLSVLVAHDAVLAANKRLVFDMWRTVLNAGHLEVADDFVAEDYIQHSPFQRSGREALKETFSVIPRSDAIPELMRPSPVAFVAEDDLVVFVAVEDLPEPDGSGSYSTTHFNMFRVVDRRLAEHWHPDQTAPCPELPSAADGGPQPVTGLTGDAQFALLTAATPELVRNKRLVFDMRRELVDAGREDLVPLYLTDNYIEHSPIGEGVTAGDERPIEAAIRSPVVALLADHDLVVLVTRMELPNPYGAGNIYTTAWFDMYRIEDGRIAEHWDAAMKPGTDVTEMGSECESSDQ